MRAKHGLRTTKKQIRANRRNARRGGPKTVAGKAASRRNARTHAVLASVLTEGERREVRKLYDRFAEDIRPEGPDEVALVEEFARLQFSLLRCARAEAEGFKGASGIDVEGARPACEGAEGHGTRGGGFDFAAFERLASTFGRYDRELTNRLIQVLQELGRLQAGRRGRRGGPSPGGGCEA